MWNWNCTVDGCEIKALAKGLCSKHYKRMERTGTTESNYVNTGRKCTISDCVEVAHRRTLCSFHYGRFLRSGDPLVGRVSLKGAQCQLCENSASAKNLCVNHYAKFYYNKKIGRITNLEEFIQKAHSILR